MGTRANIGLLENGNVTYIYNHWNGYPSGVGTILLEHYNTLDRVKRLIGLGYISSLGKFVGDEPEVINQTKLNYPLKWRKENGGHTFAKPIADVTVAYHRDRAEEWSMVKAQNEDESYFSSKEYLTDTDCEYLYIYKQDKADQWAWVAYEIRPSRLVEIEGRGER